MVSLQSKLTMTTGELKKNLTLTDCHPGDYIPSCQQIAALKKDRLSLVLRVITPRSIAWNSFLRNMEESQCAYCLVWNPLSPCNEIKRGLCLFFTALMLPHCCVSEWCIRKESLLYAHGPSTVHFMRAFFSPCCMYSTSAFMCCLSLLLSLTI